MKNLLKFLKGLFSNYWFQLICLLAVIIGIFALGGMFESWDTAGGKLMELVTSIDVLSIFLVAAVSLIVAHTVMRVMHILEESLKIEDDHHKIICKYYKHTKKSVDTTQNLYEKGGIFMYLDCVPAHRKQPKNPMSDPYSEDYKQRQKDIDAYMGGRLYLPSVNIYTNILGTTKIRFDDSAKKFRLPSFVNENALLLMGAHRNSNVSNSVTIRLNDIERTGDVLTLDTERTQYFDMLVTNRCMDYQLNDTVSIRGVYEFGTTVTPLKDSKLGNQIGINGLIFTRDGYLLVEKRGRKKTTWKDKFAQPISLALKAGDLFIDEQGRLGGGFCDAEKNFKNVILKTISKNFGIAEKDLYPFRLSDSFMGIARDLLEGGKPNMFFYVIVNQSAAEFSQFLCDKAKRAAQTVKTPAGKDEVLPTLNIGKMDSDFYLIHHDDICIDYRYVLKIKARKMYRLKRKYYPRVGRLTQAVDGIMFRLKKALNRSVKKECGEALLACMSFAGICRERIEKQFRN